MKRLLFFLLAVLTLVSLVGCAKKILHCDGCGKEIKFPANSDYTEDWILLCEECKDKVEPVVEPRD